MEWTIREARLSDCAAIAQLNREEMGYDYPEEQTREKLRACLANPAHKVLVAERQILSFGRIQLSPPLQYVRLSMRRKQGFKFFILHVVLRCSFPSPSPYRNQICISCSPRFAQQ